MNWMNLTVFCSQEIKKAIIMNMTKLGREAGLKSFEQVDWIILS